MSTKNIPYEQVVNVVQIYGLYDNLMFLGEQNSGAPNDLFGENSVIGDFPAGWQIF